MSNQIDYYFAGLRQGDCDRDVSDAYADYVLRTREKNEGVVIHSSDGTVITAGQIVDRATIEREQAWHDLVCEVARAYSDRPEPVSQHTANLIARMSTAQADMLTRQVMAMLNRIA